MKRKEGGMKRLGRKTACEEVRKKKKKRVESDV